MFEFEPVVEEAVHFGPGTRISDKSQGSTLNIGFFVEAIFPGSLQESFVWNRVPKVEGKPCRHRVVVLAFGVEKTGVKEVGGFECKQDRTFDGEFWGFSGLELCGDEFF
jgi:hypothetical protein